MKKLLFFFIFFSLLSSELIAVQEDFFCRNLKKEIIQTRDAKDLSSPEISTFKDFNFFQKMEVDLESLDWKNKFDENNYLSIVHVAGSLANKKILQVNDKIVEINGIDARGMDTKQLTDALYKNFDEKKDDYASAKLKISRKLDYVEDKIFEVNIEEEEIKELSVLNDFEIISINKIDPKLNIHEIHFKHETEWEDSRLTDISKKIDTEYRKIAFDIRSTDYQVGDYYWYCEFSKDEFYQLGLYEPRVEILNLVDYSSDKVETIFTVYYYPPNYYEGTDWREDYPDGAIKIVKTFKGTGAFRSIFSYKSFPFDAQSLTFSFASIFNAEHVDLDYTNTNVAAFNVFFKTYQMIEWDLKDYEFNYASHPVDYGRSTAQKIEIILKIERQYNYYITKIFIPILLVLGMAWSIFWISPKEIETRLTVTIVCLLSLIAYNFVIDQDLPKLKYLTIMDYIILLSYTFCTIPTVASIYAFFCYKKNPQLAYKIDNTFKIFFPIAYIFLVLAITSTILSNNPHTTQASFMFF